MLKQSMQNFPINYLLIIVPQVLIGKRIGHHAQKYSIPGGHLELGETFEETAIRELKEETNLDTKNPKVIAITNNLETYREEGLHYVSVMLLVKDFSVHNCSPVFKIITIRPISLCFV